MRYRSFFWPFALIAAGLIWLLIDLGTIPLENLWALMYIWPFVLMAIGVGLILRARWPITRIFVSGLTIAGIVLAIFFAPQLKWNQAPSWNFITFSNIGGSIRGSGNVVSETRQPGNFSAIEINYPVELTVKQGQAVTLTIQGEDNLLPQLDTRVSGSTLIIENSERNFSKRVNA